jgi:hypothetical protein
MIDFSSLLYAPLYDHFGTDAKITTPSTEAYDIRAIDFTAGVELGDGAGLLSIRPVAVVRVSDLDCSGIARKDLDGATIEINGKSWIIKATMPKPSPTGEDTGELYLVLIEGGE